jgi:TolB-like protein
MKRALIVVTLLCAAVPAFGQKTQTLSDGVQEVAKQISDGLAKQNRQRVGVTAFTDVHTGAKNLFGSYLAESITTRLVMSGLDVVERLQMEKVIAQLNLEASRVIDQETAKRVGKQAGVEAIVIGTMADMGPEIEVNVRVIDIAIGRVLAVAVTRITRDTKVSAMLGGPAASVKKEEPKPKPKPAEEEDGQLAWTVAGTRIVIDGTDRNYHSVMLALAFENDGEEERTVRSKTYYLVDENGDRYKFTHDTEKFVHDGVIIPPETRARSNFWFSCDGDCNGRKFTLLDTNNKVILRNIPVARN